MSENQNPNILPYYTSSFLVHNRDEYKKEGEKGKEEIRERKKKKKKKGGWKGVGSSRYSSYLSHGNPQIRNLHYPFV
jgi:ribosome assembly protein YihI (activator of Der GTPase)